MKRLALAAAFALASSVAWAGAWGPGSFENDDAMDWVSDCVHATSPEGITAAFDHVLKADVVEAPDGADAIAAAEVVAASLGKPSPAMPDDLKAWLARQPATQIANQAALAQRALARIQDPRHSELRQLWPAGKADPWLAQVRDLETRLARK